MSKINLEMSAEKATVLLHPLCPRRKVVGTLEKNTVVTHPTINAGGRPWETFDAL